MKKDLRIGESGIDEQLTSASRWHYPQSGSFALRVFDPELQDVFGK